jgi:hypothetical protein
MQFLLVPVVFGVGYLAGKRNTPVSDPEQVEQEVKKVEQKEPEQKEVDTRLPKPTISNPLLAAIRNGVALHTVAKPASSMAPRDAMVRDLAQFNKSKLKPVTINKPEEKTTPPFMLNLQAEIMRRLERQKAKQD